MTRKRTPKLTPKHTSPEKPSPNTPSAISVLPHPLSSLIDPSSTPSGPQTASSNDHSIQWIYRDRRPHPFTTEISSTTGVEVTKLKAFEVNGLVVDFYLRADAYAHTIRLQLSPNDIESIKTIIRTAPNHLDSNYRWPFERTIAKFISKDSKEKLASDFEPVLDGRGIDLNDLDDSLKDLTINDVLEGAKVSVEYIPVPYGGRKPNKKDDGFLPGCTLKLLLIVILEDPANLDISSPSKRRKLL